MVACWLKLCRVVTIFLVFSLMFNDVYQNTLNLQANNARTSLEGFVVAGVIFSFCGHS
jgi:hypothetical protein